MSTLTGLFNGHFTSLVASKPVTSILSYLVVRLLVSPIQRTLGWQTGQPQGDPVGEEGAPLPEVMSPFAQCLAVSHTKSTLHCLSDAELS